MPLLKSVYFQKKEDDIFPYHLPIFEQHLDVNHDVTIFVGENGSGKTTLLEIIQSALGLYRIGQPLIKMPHVKTKMTYHLHKPLGLYFSAEDFTTYIYELEKEKAYAKQQIKEAKHQYRQKSTFAQMQAQGPYRKTIAEIDQLYDRNLLKSSHGESYLSFFKSRLKPNTLILLDEPETPLSFQNQLTLLYMIHEATKLGCQFVIATHSPLMMAYPHAHIYEIDQEGIHETSYEMINHVQSMKDFLNHPDRYFRHLFKEEKHDQ